MEPTRRAAMMRLARQNRMTRIARVLSGELEGTGQVVKGVRLNNHGKACTDGALVYVPYEMDADPALNLMMQEGVLAHEVAGHMRYTNFKSWFNMIAKQKKGEEDPLMHDFVNIFEDARVNHLLAQDFPGSGKRLDATQAIFMEKHRQQWGKEDITDSNIRQAAMVAMMTECIVHKPHFFTHPDIVAYMDEVRPLLRSAISQPSTVAVIGAARKCMAVFRTYWPEDATADPSTGSAEQNGEGIILDDMSEAQIERMASAQRKAKITPEKVQKSRFNDMEMPEKSEEAAEGGAEGDEASEESNDPSEGTEGDTDGAEGEESGDDESGDGEFYEVGGGGESGDSGDGESDPSMNDGSKGGESTADDLFAELMEAIEEEAYAAADLSADLDKELDAVTENIDGGMMDGQHNIRVTHTTRELANKSDISAYTERYQETVRANRAQITTLQNTLRRLIMGRTGGSRVGLKRGDLDDSRLWQVRSTDRVFKKKDAPKKAEANVLILIDASGSMGGYVHTADGKSNRAACASEAATVLAEVLDGMGFGCEVVDFNSSYGGASNGQTSIRVRKAMNAPLNRLTRAAIRAPYIGCENADGYAVQWCINRMQNFTGHRFIFVISDGQPAGPYDPAIASNESDHLRTVVRNAPKDIGIFSVGIAGMDTSAFYPNAASVDTATLAQQCIPVLRRMLRTVKAA